MIVSQFIAILIVNLAIWQLPVSLGFLMILLTIAVIVPTCVPQRWTVAVLQSDVIAHTHA